MPKFLDGYKTYVAAAVLAFAGANSVMHWVSADHMQTIVAFAFSLGFYGLRGAISKIQENTEAVAK